MPDRVLASAEQLVAVVVTFRSDAFVGECVDAIQAQLQPGDRLVVVDNAGGDSSPAVAHAHGAEVLPLTHNIGFGSACNRGAAIAPRHDVLLVNPDAVPQPGAIQALRSALGTDATRGAVGPRIERPDGTIEPGCRRSFPRPAVALARLLRLDRLFPHHRVLSAYNMRGTDPALPGAIEVGSGAGLLVRREAWDGLGGFDERFFMYGEDIDLCRSLGDAGYTIWYEPAARFVHKKGSSTHQVPFRMLWEFHRAMWVYYCKHHRRGHEALLAPVLFVGIAARFCLLVARNTVRRSGYRTV
jgi:GT2 family glycosyltransferase